MRVSVNDTHIIIVVIINIIIIIIPFLSLINWHLSCWAIRDWIINIISPYSIELLILYKCPFLFLCFVVSFFLR
jgi:hypothetical protein